MVSEEITLTLRWIQKDADLWVAGGIVFQAAGIVSAGGLREKRSWPI